MLVDFARTLRDDGHHRRLRRRAHLHAGGGHARPHRPDGPLLGRPHDAGQPARPRARLPPGLRALLPRRRRPEHARGRSFTRRSATEARAALEVPETEGQGEEREQREARLGLVASGARTMRRKDFGACTPEELAALRRILRTMRLTPPRRRSRRTRPARSGRTLDVRRTVRETMRLHGEPAQLLRRERRLRHRPLTLILDVSGSMADYSRNLVQFAHTSTRTSSRVEVFCFGTRLTRITRELDRRRPDEALDRAAEAVLDWDGGTRIGASLDRFVRDHARARDVPRRHRGDLLRRPRPRRPGRPRGGDGAALPALPPHRLAQPAQGRAPRSSSRRRSA